MKAIHIAMFMAIILWVHLMTAPTRDPKNKTFWLIFDLIMLVSAITLAVVLALKQLPT